MTNTIEWISSNTSDEIQRDFEFQKLAKSCPDFEDCVGWYLDKNEMCFFNENWELNETIVLYWRTVIMVKYCI